MALANDQQYTLHADNPTYAFVNACIDEIQRCGAPDVVICPGSRSTPLAIACASHPAIKVWMHVDERSAAYFALGLAKKRRRTVTLICTSGTAAANFFPAIAEAKLTHVPLLVLTADRPHELRENGAPQAINQTQLYGNHVKWFAETTLPEATNVSLRYIRTLTDRAVAYTQATPAGPVHINMPFREPLVPAPIAEQPLPPLAQREEVAWSGRPHNAPFVLVDDTEQHSPSPATIQRLATQISDAEHGLLIVGPYNDPALTAPLLELARSQGYLILADPLSQLRSGPHDRSQIISSYDAFLRLDDTELAIRRLRPELIIRIGAMPTAKPLLFYLKQNADCPQLVIDADEGWNEPTQLAAQMIHADPALLCQRLNEVLSPRSEQSADWLRCWQRTDRITRESLEAAINDFREPFEGRVFVELEKLLPEQATLFASNSMPVRDMDTFYQGNQRQIEVAGNRGANGIDGIVSSAAGYSAGAVAGAPTVLVIGDLSFFHDLNGLIATRLHKLDLIVVLINNNGGGIFSFLPQAAYPEYFEQLFGTPLGLDFQYAARLHNGKYSQPQDWDQFRAAIQQGIHDGGLHIVEVRTQREQNVAMHRQLWQVVRKALLNQEDTQ